MKKKRKLRSWVKIVLMVLAILIYFLLGMLGGLILMTSGKITVCIMCSLLFIAEILIVSYVKG